MKYVSLRFHFCLILGIDLGVVILRDIHYLYRTSLHNKSQDRFIVDLSSDLGNQIGFQILQNENLDSGLTDPSQHNQVHVLKSIFYMN